MSTLMNRSLVHGRLLSAVLRVDAAAVAVLAAGLLVVSGPIEDHLGLPTTLSLVVGVALLPWLAVLLRAASRPVRAGMILGIVAGNAVWVVASVALQVADGADLTGAGTAFVLVQALGTAVIAGLEYLGLRQARRRDPSARLTSASS